jgi:hypothetical protein
VVQLIIVLSVCHKITKINTSVQEKYFFEPNRYEGMLHNEIFCDLYIQLIWRRCETHEKLCWIQPLGKLIKMGGRWNWLKIVPNIGM